MAATEFHLFRIKFIRPKQTNFIHDEELEPWDFFIRSIKSNPSFHHRQRYTWHVGNLEFFDHFYGYFAVGRTSKSTVEIYDKETKNFIIAEQNESPYTHCLFDAKLGIIIIAKKSSLNQDTKKIAEKIEQLLMLNTDILANDIRVEISPIPDPDGFIMQVSRAFQITRFTASFGGPNPFDADEYFQRPNAVYLKYANGHEGQTTIKGDRLSSETITAVTKSTAATGNQASARIKRYKSSKLETIHLNGDPVKRRLDEESNSWQDILDTFRKVYLSIRH